MNSMRQKPFGWYGKPHSYSFAWYCLLACRLWYVLLVRLQYWSLGYRSKLQPYFSPNILCTQLSEVSVLTTCDTSVIDLISWEQGIWKHTSLVGTLVSVMSLVLSMYHSWPLLIMFAVTRFSTWSEAHLYCRFESGFNSSTGKMSWWHR